MNNHTISPPSSLLQAVPEWHACIHLLQTAGVLAFSLACLVSYLGGCRQRAREQKLPTVNRLFRYEPHVVSRVRWAFWARSLVDAGTRENQGRPWRLARGDKDLIVFPGSYVPDLNKMPSAVTNSRRYHSETMVSHLTGMMVITKTGLHHRVLLGRISPAMPNQLLGPTARRTASAIDRLFPQDTTTWTEVNVLDIVVESVTQGVALGLVGPGACDSPYLVQLLVQHTRNVFAVAFVLRFVPSVLAGFIVWLVPFRWALARTWYLLEQYVRPLVLERQHIKEEQQKEQERSGARGNKSSKTAEQHEHPDMVTSMVLEARSAVDTDPHMLARLVGAVAAGGTFSIANFVTGVLADLVSDPELIDELRDEIRAKNAECGGQWDAAAFGSLWKLESVMKETARMAPGSLVVLGRSIDRDHVLPDDMGEGRHAGLTLRKGDSISVSSRARSMDESIFENPKVYDGRRFYRRGIEDLRARPFTSIDGDLLTWGSGRWACPGRFIANLSVKVALVKILDEFDFGFRDGGRRPPNVELHEFTFVPPSMKMMFRKRTDPCGIHY